MKVHAMSPSISRARRSDYLLGHIKKAQLKLDLLFCRRRLRILEDAACQISAVAPVEDVLDQIVAKAAASLRLSGYAVSVNLPAGGRHTRREGTGTSMAAGSAKGLVLPGQNGSLLDGRAVMSADIASEATCYGRLAAVGQPGRRFTSADRAALTAYARLAAATLDAAASSVAVEESGETARLLLQVARTLAQQPTVGSVAASIANAIPGLAGADRSGVTVWDAECGKIRVAGMSGWSGELAERFAVHAAKVKDSPELTEIMSTGAPLLVDRSGSEWANTIFDEFSITAFVAVPVIAGRGLTGLVVACWAEAAAPETLCTALAERLRGLAGLAAVALDNVRLLEDTRHQALHDALTGLPNRTLLEDKMIEALSSAARTGSRVGLLFCDVNRFKRINDSLGHAAGDSALRHVAARLRKAVRDSDTVARFSGDEFVILLPDAGSAEEVDEVAARVRASLSSGIEVADRRIFVDVAIGTGLSGRLPADPAHEVLADAARRLVESADVEMYRNRARARGQVPPDVTRESSLQLETELRGAAERNELRVQFQPQIDIASGEVVGAEALVRWQHPELGLIPPADFIPVAEASGLVTEVGAHVLTEACRSGAALHAQGHQIEVSVNVSAVQLGDPGFIALVRDTLSDTGFPARALTLEITESQAVTENTANDGVLHELKALGTGISVDDFGTGYSSLAQLHRLPVTEVKIDRSFINRLTDDSDSSAAFVRAIVGLGSGLDLRVVAEGVETPDQLDALHSLGCDRAQGYLLGKPADITDLEALLEATPSSGQALVLGAVR